MFIERNQLSQSYQVSETKRDLEFEYRQEFVIKAVGDEVIATTPRSNEPAVFIDNVELKLTVSQEF